MGQIFFCVLSLSVAGAVTGAVLLLLHPLTKRVFSSKWNYYIWLLVAARLLIPVSVGVPFFGSDRSEAHWKQFAGQSVMSSEEGLSQEKLPGKDTEVFPEGAADETLLQNEKTAKEAVRGRAAGLIWILGAITAFAARLAGYRRFEKQIRRKSHPVTERGICAAGEEMAAGLHMKKPEICESPDISGPITLGLRKPVILLPEGTQGSPELSLVLHHELIHVRRKDLWYKWMYQLLLCVHWFNPVLYLVNRRLNIDCELACDEAVCSMLTREGKNAYGNILIDAAHRNIDVGRGVPATTLLERKKDLKERLWGILHYKKKSMLRTVCSACVLAGLLFLSACGNPYTMPFHISGEAYRHLADEGEEGREDDEDMGFMALAASFLNRFMDEESFMESPFEIDTKGEACRAYDEDEIIAGRDVQDKWAAYVYSGNKGNINSRSFLFDGTDTILIVYAKEETEIRLDSSFEMRDGKFKLVHITPQGEVLTVDDTGEGGQKKVTLEPGRNVVKMVGQKARIRNLKITLSGLQKKDFDAVYYSEADEYVKMLLEDVRKGEARIDKARVMETLYRMEAEEASDVFAAMLDQGENFSPDELEELFIFSDAGLSTGYLADAVEKGAVGPLDAKQLSTILPFTEGEGRIRLIASLSGEITFDRLEEWAPYLEDEEWELLLVEYVKAGNKLTYSQIAEIAVYLNQETLKRLDSLIE